ncbi:MAG: sigma 54-interacting transcriptional regulator, partial [Candidatus Latescibacteria bacterium]|nr:sigma 54-interacting transcriptional regulator [Candidatus Latescibacterota bacterium]
GLTRYDGTTFEILDVSLDYSFLWGSCMDESGDLWFGLDRRPGRPAGVVRWDGSDLELIEAEGSEGISGNSVKSVACSAERGIYLCANDLYHISSGRLSKLRWPIEEGAHHHFNRLGFGSTGVLTVLTSTGAFTWEGSDLRKISKADMPGYASFAVHDDVHFLGSHAGRLERVSNEESDNELQISKSIQSLLTDSAGNLWVGTFGAGLARTEPGVWRLFDGDGPEWSPLSITRRNGKDGVWVGSTHGLGTATESGWSNPQVQSRYAITAVCQDDSDGVWMGERNGAVSLVRDGKEFRRFTSAEVRGFRVSTIAHGDDDVWYSCSPGLGLRRIRAQSDPPVDEVVNGAPSWVGALCYSQSRGLLIGTNSGDSDRVIAYKDGEFLSLAEMTHPVTAIVELGDEIYVGTTRGLEILRERSSELDRGGLEDFCVKCLCVDQSERLWVGTEGAGMYLCRDAEMSQIRLPQGISWQIIDAIEVDSSEGVWIATPGGLALYTQRSLGAQLPALQVIAEGATNSIVTIEAHQECSLRFAVRGHGWPSIGSVIRWRIPEFDLAWVTSETRSVTLPRLPEGSYSIEAYGRDRNLNRSQEFRTQIHVTARRVDLMIEEALKGQPTAELIGRSEASDNLRQELTQAALSELPVLLLGETGTGKTMAAKMLHDISHRSKGPFVSVNCAAIADSLAESELFGHVKGAFTGAVRDRVGKFELANGGTLLLDEIGDLSQRIQAKLLHVLHDGYVEPLGGSEPVRVDVRVIGATNRDVDAAIASHQFREDLYYRLNAFEIEVPALHRREEDIELLAEVFMRQVADRLSLPSPMLDPQALSGLLAHNWPGNVRELKHVIERGVILSSGGLVTLHHLALRQAPQPITVGPSIVSWDEHEREYLEMVLASTNGVVAGEGGAASALGLKPSTLRSRMKRLGIL